MFALYSTKKCARPAADIHHVGMIFERVCAQNFFGDKFLRRRHQR